MFLFFLCLQWATGQEANRDDLLNFSVPEKRAHHALVYDEKNGRILLTAGSTPVDGGKSFIFYNDLWTYDGRRWKKNGNAGDKRSGVRLAYDCKRNCVYSFGGYTGDTSLCDLRVLRNEQWEIVSRLPEMKGEEAGLVYDDRLDKLILFGGSGSMGKVHAETWLWDGKVWEKSKSPGPDERQAFAMVYDSKRKKTIVFGGMGGDPRSIFRDTWEFDGESWQKVCNSTGPGFRTSPGFTFDSKRGLFIIYGGTTDFKSLGDTWGWNGIAWKKLAENGPPARAIGGMAYDKRRDRVVLFGGILYWPVDANDTWEWDGAIWKKVAE